MKCQLRVEDFVQEKKVEVKNKSNAEKKLDENLKLGKISPSAYNYLKRTYYWAYERGFLYLQSLVDTISPLSRSFILKKIKKSN